MLRETRAQSELESVVDGAFAVCEAGSVTRPRPIPTLDGEGRIKTSCGEKPLNALVSGDLLLTRDNGYQPVLWAGQPVQSRSAPVKIAASAFGPGLPSSDVVLSTNQRLLAVSIGACGVPRETLVRVSDLVARPGVEKLGTSDAKSGCCILMQRHELVLVNDLWTETFLPDANHLGAMPKKHRARFAQARNGSSGRIYAPARAQMRIG